MYQLKLCLVSVKPQCNMSFETFNNIYLWGSLFSYLGARYKRCHAALSQDTE